jgi:exodeoxyribonuclease VII small subunit
MSDRGPGTGLDPVETPAGPMDPEQLSFEELVAALEALTDRLASGQIGIEEAADLYERAERLHALASQRLARVQARIDALGTTKTPTN